MSEAGEGSLPRHSADPSQYPTRWNFLFSIQLMRSELGEFQERGPARKLNSDVRFYLRQARSAELYLHERLCVRAVQNQTPTLDPAACLRALWAAASHETCEVFWLSLPHLD